MFERFILIHYNKKGKSMNKIKKYISLIIGVIFIFTLLNFTVIYAEEKVVTSTAVVDGRNVTITGKITNAGGSNQVTLLVGDIDNILYIDQTTSTSAGTFSFDFAMPESLSAGSYSYKIGSDSGAELHTGTIAYHGGIPEQSRKFVDADIDIALSSYVPSVNGTITCMTGKNVVINIVNVTDNTVIKSETVTSESGVYELSCTLPSLIYSKTYQISVVCNDDNGALLSINADIVSATYKVTVNGTVATADNVTMNISAKSTNTDLIDKSGTISGTRTESISIPNLIPSAAFEVSVDGYEKYYPAEEYATCAVTGVAGEEVMVVAKGWNISSFEDRTIELSYDATQLEAVSLFGAFPEDSLVAGQKGNVEIVSYIPGKIVFKIHNINIPDGKVWSGAMNLFKFRFAEGHTGGSALNIKF